MNAKGAPVAVWSNGADSILGLHVVDGLHGVLIGQQVDHVVVHLVSQVNREADFCVAHRLLVVQELFPEVGYRFGDHLAVIALEIAPYLLAADAHFSAGDHPAMQGLRCRAQHSDRGAEPHSDQRGQDLRGNVAGLAVVGYRYLAFALFGAEYKQLAKAAFMVWVALAHVFLFRKLESCMASEARSSTPIEPRSADKTETTISPWFLRPGWPLDSAVRPSRDFGNDAGAAVQLLGSHVSVPSASKMRDASSTASVAGKPVHIAQWRSLQEAPARRLHQPKMRSVDDSGAPVPARGHRERPGREAADRVLRWTSWPSSELAAVWPARCPSTQFPGLGTLLLVGTQRPWARGQQRHSKPSGIKIGII